ncbi:amino acid transporter [Artomyces pyxidatus]|uniref:Amino acid transporter n=1 Tax=Artomyces pyxidatus TaxID=48021 RepID=A0ACB8SNC6_9AGAM|nr:amino acid transporter [Artomyces pyxidatus]
MSSPISKNSADVSLSVDEDELQLEQLGYKQQLHRTWNFFENFAASFVSVNFMVAIRTTFFLGLLAGGPQAVWSTYLITMIFMTLTALVIAEVCSALPLSGSIYIWAAASAGPKYARFFGFVVACWAISAWIALVAVTNQSTTNYLVSQLSVWEVDFPGGRSNDNIKWRTFVWAISQGFLIVSVAMNYLPPKAYSGVFRVATVLVFVDFLLCVIWLPIGVHNTYGFRSAKDVFTMTYNGTGAPPAWNWILSFFFSAPSFIGFDASGHVAEETKRASIIAGRGIISCVVTTAVFGFATVILFLFCMPSLDVFFALDAPQPFVQLYALALGKRPSIFMTAVAVISNTLSSTVLIVATSRLIFAVARDGVLPLSGWIGQVNRDKQPRNAVTVVFVFSAALLCTILPSQVAFTSLLSSSGVAIISAYGLIALLRLAMTPHAFKTSHLHLGRLALPIYFVTVVWNGLIFAVLMSPFYFPANAQNFNFACVIFSFVTILAVAAWWFTPAEKWLRQEQIEHVFYSADGHPDATVSVAVDPSNEDSEK